MNDGPLIVQSDKTLLLEVDHAARRRLPARDRAVRRARARARARPHLPAHPARPVERPRRRPRRRAGRRHAAELLAATPCRTRCSSTSPRPWPATAGCGCYSTPPTAWCCTPPTGRCWRRSCDPSSPAAGRRAASTTTPSPCTPASAELKQALLKLGWPAEDLAGYVDGEAHPIELDEDGWSLRPTSSEAVEGVLARRLAASSCCPCGAGKTLVGAAAMAQAKATTLILVTNTVAARQWRDELLKPDHPHRGRDRGVLRRQEGDPAGHHRDLPGDDDAPEGRLHATSSCSTPATGA